MLFRSMEKMEGFKNKGFIERKLLPSSFIDSHINFRSKAQKSSLVKNMRKQKLLTSKEPVKHMVQGVREYCYEMTDLFLEKVKCL